ncbi:hypothetical protein [Agrobacterium tumefaciens]|uniref:hypothetical protein n=1 Tax=Agrobacterium tumefaciens TaxID=358 RepID=UPI003BA0ADAC
MRKKLNDGPVLRERPVRYDKNGKLTHRGSFFIDDIGAKPRQTATGCTFISAEEYVAAKEAAQLKLHDYNVARFAAKAALGVVKGASLEAEHVKIGDLILFYLHSEAKEIAAKPDARRREHLSQIECLSDFWGDKFVSEINRINSRAYQEGKKPSVVRNKLILLKSIVNYGAGQSQVKIYENQLDYFQPSRLPSRADYYEVDELITMYKAACRKRHSWREGRAEVLAERGETFDEQPKTFHNHVARHIAKFLVVAAYTGTRSARIQEASFVREAGRPFIDLENGIFYRAALNEKVALNKRADPIKIPERLLRMMKRWHAGSAKVPGCRYLVEYRGRPVDCRKGFHTLKKAVLSEERAKVLNRHSLKHTAATMLLKDGVSVEAVAQYLSTTPEIIRQVYSQVIPGELSEVHRSLNKKRSRPRIGEKPEDRKAA